MISSEQELQNLLASKVISHEMPGTMTALPIRQAKVESFRQPNLRSQVITKKAKTDYSTISHPERVKIFKELLKDVGVTRTWKWDDAARVIKEESRYAALEPIEQAMAFREYI